uniref:Uncharacterized protein n=1 Tax=Meloidogyne enterolobii TaxID=390850 RepID=A0A6V7U1R5_MELEN|nr:unnamed protein product [Meloidogyne enterolobii]
MLCKEYLKTLLRRIGQVKVEFHTKIIHYPLNLFFLLMKCNNHPKLTFGYRKLSKRETVENLQNPSLLMADFADLLWGVFVSG